eukprot:2131645-Amphidinium_carterae.1
MTQKMHSALSTGACCLCTQPFQDIAQHCYKFMSTQCLLPRTDMISDACRYSQSLRVCVTVSAPPDSLGLRSLEPRRVLSAINWSFVCIRLCEEHTPLMPCTVPET